MGGIAALRGVCGDWLVGACGAGRIGLEGETADGDVGAGRFGLMGETPGAGFRFEVGTGGGGAVGRLSFLLEALSIPGIAIHEV